MTDDSGASMEGRVARSVAPSPPSIRPSQSTPTQLQDVSMLEAKTRSDTNGARQLLGNVSSNEPSGVSGATYADATSQVLPLPSLAIAFAIALDPDLPQATSPTQNGLPGPLIDHAPAPPPAPAPSSILNGVSGPETTPTPVVVPSTSIPESAPMPSVSIRPPAPNPQPVVGASSDTVMIDLDVACMSKDQLVAELARLEEEIKTAALEQQAAEAVVASRAPFVKDLEDRSAEAGATIACFNSIIQTAMQDHATLPARLEAAKRDAADSHGVLMDLKAQALEMVWPFRSMLPGEEPMVTRGCSEIRRIDMDGKDGWRISEVGRVAGLMYFNEEPDDPWYSIIKDDLSGWDSFPRRGYTYIPSEGWQIRSHTGLPPGIAAEEAKKRARFFEMKREERRVGRKVERIDVDKEYDDETGEDGNVPPLEDGPICGVGAPSTTASVTGSLHFAQTSSKSAHKVNFFAIPRVRSNKNSVPPQMPASSSSTATMMTDHRPSSPPLQRDLYRMGPTYDYDAFHPTQHSHSHPHFHAKSYRRAPWYPRPPLHAYFGGESRRRISRVAESWTPPPVWENENAGWTEEEAMRRAIEASVMDGQTGPSASSTVEASGSGSSKAVEGSSAIAGSAGAAHESSGVGASSAQAPAKESTAQNDVGTSSPYFFDSRRDMFGAFRQPQASSESDLATKIKQLYPTTTTDTATTSTNGQTTAEAHQASVDEEIAQAAGFSLNPGSSNSAPPLVVPTPSHPIAPSTSSTGLADEAMSKRKYETESAQDGRKGSKSPRV